MKLARTTDIYKEGAYLSGEMLVINKKRYSVDQLDTLPPDLNPRLTSIQKIGQTTFFYSRHSPLSNHFMGAPFTIGHTMYCCTEQRYFAAKADYLGDDERLAAIMLEREPQQILSEGKKIVAKNLNKWEDVEVHEMLTANRAKYIQNAGVRATLMSTKDTSLAEASQFDGHWGIGMKIGHEDLENTNKWGLNLMGGILETLRAEFRIKGPSHMDKK